MQAHQQLMELLMEMQNSLKGEEKDQGGLLEERVQELLVENQELRK